MMTSRNQPLLLVRDSPEDRETTSLAAEEGGHPRAPIVFCVNGDDVLNFLRHRGQYADNEDAVRPFAVMLDLNMPGTDGREVLAEIKKDQDLKSIPVLIVTTSRDDRDIRSCYESGANAYASQARPISAPSCRRCSASPISGFTEAVLP